MREKPALPLPFDRLPFAPATLAARVWVEVGVFTRVKEQVRLVDWQLHRFHVVSTAVCSRDHAVALPESPYLVLARVVCDRRVPAINILCKAHGWQVANGIY